MLSGAWEDLWDQHNIDFDPDLGSKWQARLPILSFRMSNLSAAILNPQIRDIEHKIKHINTIYNIFYEKLSKTEHIDGIKTLKEVRPAYDIFPFHLKTLNAEERKQLIEHCKKVGIILSGFDNPGNARCYWNWHFLEDRGSCPKTVKLLKTLMEIRINYHLPENIAAEVADIILHEIDSIKR